MEQVKTQRETKKRPRKEAFTLIELLIVVAIIAILAAIAIPNFLEAQVRSKVARGDADLRTITTALESYAVDYTRYPPRFVDDLPVDGLERLTTPIAYITSVPNDVFQEDEDPRYNYFERNSYGWTSTGSDGGWTWGWKVGWERADNCEWVLNGVGPDQIWNFQINSSTQYIRMLQYDPSNGTVSDGDVFRFQTNDNHNIQ